jgi:hypothetical protein
MRGGNRCSGANRPGVCLFSGRVNSYDDPTNSGSHAMSPLTLDRLPDTVTLHPGQALRTSLDPASWLEMLEGCAQLASPPSWFGDTVFTVKTVLNDGDVHRLERGGWIELSALTPVRLRVHAPQQVADAPASRPVETRPVMRLVRLLTGT